MGAGGEGSASIYIYYMGNKERADDQHARLHVPLLSSPCNADTPFSFWYATTLALLLLAGRGKGLEGTNAVFHACRRKDTTIGDINAKRETETETE